MNETKDFWSRRRDAVRAEAEAENAVLLAEQEAAERRELETKSDAEILEELDLPDPDTLEAGDDFSAFMSKAVPERLRRRALRRLWGSNAVLANVDGLVDYGEDYTDAATVIPDMKTVYQVGKGMFARIVEADPDISEAPIEDEDDVLEVVNEEYAAGPLISHEAVVVDEVVDDDEPAPVRSSRRMRFMINRPEVEEESLA